MKILLFDIDGTLLLTGGAGKIAIERAFEELFGIPEVWGDLIPDGKTDPMIFREIATRVLKRDLRIPEYERLSSLYLDYFPQEMAKATRFCLLPGVLEILGLLSQREHFLMGVATGNFEEAAWAKLERGKIRHFFRFGGFGSDAENRFELTRMALERGKRFLKSEISNEDVVVIGDTVHDIAAGKKLGVKTVAVATGQTRSEELMKHSPDFLLKDFRDTKDFLKFL